MRSIIVRSRYRFAFLDNKSQGSNKISFLFHSVYFTKIYIKAFIRLEQTTSEEVITKANRRLIKVIHPLCSEEQPRLDFKNDNLNKTGHNSWWCITSAIKQYKNIKRLGNSIFAKSNIKPFVMFTNCNLSLKFVIYVLIFFQLYWRIWVST